MCMDVGGTKEETYIFPVLPSHRTRGNGHEMKCRNLHLNVRRILVWVQMSIVRLPRDVGVSVLGDLIKYDPGQSVVDDPDLSPRELQYWFSRDPFQPQILWSKDFWVHVHFSSVSKAHSSSVSVFIMVNICFRYWCEHLLFISKSTILMLSTFHILISLTHFLEKCQQVRNTF